MDQDDIQTLYDQGPDAVEAAIAVLIARYETELITLQARVQVLADRLAKDSHHSHLPPSRDLPPKPTSLRTKSGRKPGGQPGHRGTTLAWSVAPDAVVTHAPTTCAWCGASLASASVVGDVRRQVVELPVLRLVTTEHVGEQRRCRRCGRRMEPDQLWSRLPGLAVYLHQFQLLPYVRIQTFLADLFACSLSAGTVVTAVAAADALLAPTEATIQQAVRQTPVAHFDETSLRVAGRPQWVHVACTDQWTHYHVTPQARASRDGRGGDPAGLSRGRGA